MVKMAMRDKNKILLNSSSWAPSNIKSTLEFGYYHASFVATNRNAFNRVAFQVYAFPDDGGPSFTVLFFFVDGAADGGQNAGGFESIYWIDMGLERKIVGR